MTHDIVSVSQAELAQRRRQLKQQRRTKLLQTSWRILAVLGLAGAMVWIVTSPEWVLRRPEQIKVEGNHLLKADRVRSLIPIRYPLSLLKLEPQGIAASLKTKIPLAAEVTVNRQLFPPGLTVQLVERLPVAIALPSTAASTDTAKTIPNPTTQSGLLDANGNWVPLEASIATDQSVKLPSLKVTGNLEQYRRSWSKIYQEVSRSPVKIVEIDWRDPTNLILKTELGTVYFGPYSPQFSYQLNILDKMRQLPSRIDSQSLAFIDLRNPATPTVQMSKI